jgi:hypothetical protein
VLTVIHRKVLCPTCKNLIFGTAASLICVLCGTHVDDPHPHEAVSTTAIYAPPVRAITSTNTTTGPRQVSVYPQQIPDVGYGYAQIYRPAVKS